jgi:succinate dehydrogenase / fumarate reductase, cytochrome b subunit
MAGITRSGKGTRVGFLTSFPGSADEDLAIPWSTVAIQTSGQTSSRPSGATLVAGARAARTTIYLKILMAVSGLVFVAFVLLHMYGNLKAFAGHDAFNEYAEHLRTMGTPILPRSGALWIIRAVLIASLVVHVACAAALWRRARRARTVRYEVKKHTGAIFASRLMRWGGVTILLFIVWHLLNFTIGKVNVQGGPTNDPYNLLVDTFDTWWLTLIYLAAMTMLGAHLHHGTWSAMQTLGLTGTARARARSKKLALVVALVVTIGFSIVPVFVLAGVIDK